MVKKIKITSKSALKTKEIGEKFAVLLSQKDVSKKALIIGLKGELGGGKTTFIQGFAKGLVIKERILSPTFVIMKNFPINIKTSFERLYHFDVYRINQNSEMNTLGFKDIISDPHNIILIEWINLIEQIIPKDAIIINFRFIDENTRELTIEAPKDILRSF